MIFLFDFRTTPFFTLLFEEYLTSYICDRYLVCLPGSPTTTNPGIGPELSMMTPLDVALLHRSAPLQLITVEKYLTPWLKDEFQALSEIFHNYSLVTDIKYLALGCGFLVSNATFNHISVKSFIGGGNRTSRRKPSTCR
jgi:hypothetical protein